MSSFIRTTLIFVIPVLVLAGMDYLFFIHTNQETEEFNSRVRFLAVAVEEVDRADALDEIYIEGEINTTTLKEFKETISRHKLKNAKVIFSSDGGDLHTAIELGRLIRELGFSTSVGAYTQTWNDPGPAGCFSACTLAFLGGKYRFFSLPSEFGVHQYRSVGLYNGFKSDIESETQRFSGHLLEYLAEMGVDTAFYQETVYQDHEGIEFLSPEELTRMRVVNNGIYPPVWKLSMSGPETILTGQQDRIGQHNGGVTIRCLDDIRIELWSESARYKPTESERSDFMLHAGENSMPIKGQVLFNHDKTDSDLMPLEFKPDRNDIIGILGAQGFAFSHKSDGAKNISYQVDFGVDRAQIAEFMRRCKL